MVYYCCMNEHFERAIKVFGNGAALGRAMKVSRTTISKMRKNKIIITAERAKQLEKLTKGVVTRYDLRPDLFGNIDNEAA